MQALLIVPEDSRLANVLLADVWFLRNGLPENGLKSFGLSQLDLRESVFTAIKHAQVFAVSVNAVKVTQQIKGLLPALVVGHELIEPLKILSDPVHQNLPGGVDSLEFSKGRCEVAIVEHRERDSPT